MGINIYAYSLTFSQLDPPISNIGFSSSQVDRTIVQVTAETVNYINLISYR